MTSFKSPQSPLDTMLVQTTEVSLRGKKFLVPSIELDGRTVIVTGRFLRVASIRDAHLEGPMDTHPGELVRGLGTSRLKADILTFSQKIYESQPIYDYPYEWDNAAVACSEKYDDWWNGLSQASRKNVRRASKRGVSVEVAKFDQDLVAGIKRLYDESPIRQGRRFWHFGKPLETVWAENSTYLEQSEFIGAYIGGELIGFMKFVYVGKVAFIMQILSSSLHQDKRPMNALIAKAMEICHERRISYLVYSKFSVGNKKNDDVAEFKRRNGFVQMNYPTYFVPLTTRGRIAVSLKLHRGVLGLLPSSVIQLLSSVRSQVLKVVFARDDSGESVQSASPVSKGETE